MKYRLDWLVRKNLGDSTSFRCESQDFDTLEEAQNHFVKLVSISNPDYKEYYSFSLFKYENVTHELQK